MATEIYYGGTRYSCCWSFGKLGQPVYGLFMSFAPQLEHRIVRWKLPIRTIIPALAQLDKTLGRTGPHGDLETQRNLSNVLAQVAAAWAGAVDRIG